MRISKEAHVKRMGERAARRNEDARRICETYPDVIAMERMRAARRKNGVGRPPVKGEWSSWSRGAQADQVNDMADKNPMRNATRWRNWVAIPPGTWGYTSGRYAQDMARSTAALRKSNQRKGRA